MTNNKTFQGQSIGQYFIGHLTGKKSYYVFHDPVTYSWKMAIEGLPAHACPVLLTDLWISKVNKKQRNIIMKILKEHEVDPYREIRVVSKTDFIVRGLKKSSVYGEFIEYERSKK